MVALMFTICVPKIKNLNLQKENSVLLQLAHLKRHKKKKKKVIKIRVGGNITYLQMA